MLSYRHAFHAGNFADVLKHSVLTSVLEYMTRKDKGFSYIDTHAGAGMYSLLDEKAEKTGEFKAGIQKLYQQSDLPEVLQNYVDLIKELNNEGELSLYPGSPGIAKEFVRRQDTSQLFELHPTDNQLLNEFTQRWNKSHVHQSDGYKGLLGLLPPPSRRAVVLIDPPFEIKDDYPKAVGTVIKAYQKFPSATYIIWYPVVQRHYIETMISLFQESPVKNLLQVEYQQKPDSAEFGMTGTGLFIVNPPWLLKNQLEDALPVMKKQLGDQTSSFTLEQLIEE